MRRSCAATRTACSGSTCRGAWNRKKALNEVAGQATRSGSLDVMNDIETARKRLDKVVARIRYADRGYAGFFDAIKVDEDMLGRVYQFDLDLIHLVDETAAAPGRGPP